MGNGVKTDKDNTKLHTQNSNKGKIIIQLQSFINFQVIGEKHEKSINRASQAKFDINFRGNICEYLKQQPEHTCMNSKTIKHCVKT